jgi:hypothetical protein
LGISLDIEPEKTDGINFNIDTQEALQEIVSNIFEGNSPFGSFKDLSIEDFSVYLYREASASSQNTA